MRSLRLRADQLQAMVDHARRAQPSEACGIIAGRGHAASRIFPILNAASEPVYHYQMDAKILLRTLKDIDAAEEDVVGVYHSHPAHDPIPSPEDIREAQLNMPHVVHVIVSLKYGKARLQGWHIHDGQADKVELLVGNQMSTALPSLTRTQIIAVLLAAILAVLLLLTISLSLLPPAPPIPTPQ